MAAAGLILAFSLAASMPEVSDRPEMADCGPMALALLLRLEGRPGDPASVVARLPSRRSGNYSMLELSDAARSLGMDLKGVRIGRGDRVPDRPILVLLDRKPDGHFVVVRPVGQTGKLVQVVDPVGRLEVLDASALYASREWTGLALIPRRPSWAGRLGIALGLASLVVVASRLATRLRRRPTPETPAQPELLSAERPVEA